MTAKEKAKQEAKENLLRFINPGDTIYTILRHVSASGMSRDISIVVNKEGSMLHPNYYASVLLGDRLVSKNGHDAIRVQGCGMDMGFHLVHSLSWLLFNDANALRHQWL